MTISRQKLNLRWSWWKQKPSLVGITQVPWFGNRKGRCGIRGRKEEEKNLVRTKEKTSTQWHPTFTKCPFYFFPHAGLIQYRTTSGIQTYLPNTTSNKRDKWVSFQLQSCLFEFYFRVLLPINLLKNNHISIVWHSMPCSTYYFAGTKLKKETKFEAQILCVPEFTVTLILK